MSSSLHLVERDDEVSQDNNTRAAGAAGAQPVLEVIADREKVLPLPEWLKKLYFIFPVILYIPDVIFNYYVYSDGWKTASDPILQVLQAVLVGFLSVGIVGMAYLLSVLAPWHWGQGHHIQAFFCAVGVIIATAITTWNSLAYRSLGFVSFKTDDWVWSAFPDLKTAGVSVTMILVAVAPPFWGLFWAVVQPTETGRTLRQLQESHAERLMRMQQEAELKKLRAETNAKIREAQLRGMASTVGAAREQATGFLAQGRKKSVDGQDQEEGDVPGESEAASTLATGAAGVEQSSDLTGSSADPQTDTALEALAPAATLIDGPRRRPQAPRPSNALPGSPQFQKDAHTVIQYMRTQRMSLTVEQGAEIMGQTLTEEFRRAFREALDEEPTRTRSTARR